MYDDSGRLTNPSLLDYRKLTAADLPNIETIIVEVPAPAGPFGARGVGEPPIVPAPAAIANAIQDATGVAPHRAAADARADRAGPGQRQALSRASMKAGEIFVAGKWQATAVGRDVPRRSTPPTKSRWPRSARATSATSTLAVAAARKAFDEGPWPKMSPHERGRIVWKLGDLIQQNLDEMARLESLCTGKTMFDSGKVEIPFAAEVFRYYAGWATKIHGETLQPARQRLHLHAAPAGRRGRRHRAVELPVPALVLEARPRPWPPATRWCIKPASQTPLTALKFAELCQEAGLPEGVFNVVTGPGGKVGMALVRDPARGQDRLHRLHRGRQADHARGGRDAEAPVARARRQVAEHRLRRRRHGRGGARRA